MDALKFFIIAALSITTGIAEDKPPKLDKEKVLAVAIAQRDRNAAQARALPFIIAAQNADAAVQKAASDAIPEKDRSEWQLNLVTLEPEKISPPQPLPAPPKPPTIEEQCHNTVDPKACAAELNSKQLK